MNYAPSRSLRQIGLALALLLAAALPLLAEAPPPAAAPPLAEMPQVTPAQTLSPLPWLDVPAPILAGGGGICDPENQCTDCTACCIEWGGSGGICAGGTVCFCWW